MNWTNELSDLASQDILDPRDLWKRLEELQSIRDALETAKTELEDLKKSAADIDESDTGDAAATVHADIENARETLSEAKSEFDEIADELKALEDLENEIDRDETLIAESHFEDYARETAEDCYSISDCWPFTCIDWKKAARELQHDYTAVEIGGNTFYQRT